MTLEEIKEILNSRQLPAEFKLSDWEHITNVDLFVRVQLQMCEQVGENYQRTAPWQRLTRFEEATRDF